MQRVVCAAAYGVDARVSKSGSGGSRTYKRDGSSVTAPVLSDGVSSMVPGISERSGGTTRFSLLDRLGTNAKTVSGASTVVDAKSYDAFGMGISVVNPSGSQKGFASAFGYQEDSESGLKLLGHRYYDAATGRFITRDPIGSGTNWYKYADNNPLKSVDPSGLEEISLQDYDAKHGTKYTDRTQQRIDALRKNGETQAADELQSLLDNGRIFIETDDSKMKGRSDDGTEFNAGGMAYTDKIVLIDGMHTWSFIDYECVLLHEVTHVLDLKSDRPATEGHATEVTIAYAQKMEAVQLKAHDNIRAQEYSRHAKFERDYASRRVKSDRTKQILWIFRHWYF